MKITEFKKIGKTNRFKIFVDGEFFGTLLDETIIQNGLNTTTEYDFETLSNIINLGQNKLAFDTALTYISKFTKSEKELKIYLRQKGFSENAVDFAIEKLKSFNYLNDENYARNYVNMKINSKGKKAIFFELKNKEIDEQILHEILDEIPSQKDAIFALALKFVRTKKNDEKLREKLFRHLASKGFDFEEINSVVNEVLKNNLDD